MTTPAPARRAPAVDAPTPVDAPPAAADSGALAGAPGGAEVGRSGRAPAGPAGPAVPVAPGGGRLPASVVARNVRLVQRDSVAVGIVNASTPFLPVLLLRLGGTTLQVSLLTALPAIAGFLFAIPLGRFLQRRRNVVPWYSAARLVAQLAFGAMALAMLMLPEGPGWARGAAPAALAVLAIWALQTLPNTMVNVAFPVLMDGASGPSHRMDLLSRRWSIMGLTTAITVAVAGQFLGILPFPRNYALVFGAFAGSALASWWYSHRVRLPDHVPSTRAAGAGRGPGGGLRALVRAQPAFMTFEVRSFVYTAGVYMATPLVPLYYVREVHASDAWIGLIGAATAATQLVGYWLWRRVSARHGTRRVLVITILGNALGPVALSLLGALPLVVLLAATTSIFYAGASLVLFEELMRRVPRPWAVSFTAIDQSTQNLAATIAPLTGGLLATVFGIRYALAIATCLGVIAFVLFALEGRSAVLPGPAARGTRRVAATRPPRFSRTRQRIGGAPPGHAAHSNGGCPTSSSARR